MKDLYLKTLTEADMKAALIAAGIVTEQTIATEVGATEDGDAILQDVTALVPTRGFYVDQIGPFSKVIGYDEAGEPILENYPDWHTNLRGSFNEDQLALLTPLSVEPTVPYRVWA
jgi:hypothetical protein